MSPYDTSIVDILADIPDPPDPGEDYDIAEDVAQAIYERVEDLPPIAQWDAPVRNFFSLYELNFQVGNGGFAQAAYNTPELLPLAEKAFVDLGCDDAARLCRTAMEMLPRDAAERSAQGVDQTTSVGDAFEFFNNSDMASLESGIPDEFWVEERLSHYVLTNREAFLSLE